MPSVPPWMECHRIRIHLPTLRIRSCTHRPSSTTLRMIRHHQSCFHWPDIRLVVIWPLSPTSPVLRRRRRHRSLIFSYHFMFCVCVLIDDVVDKHYYILLENVYWTHFFLFRNRFYWGHSGFPYSSSKWRSLIIYHTVVMDFDYAIVWPGRGNINNLLIA